MIEISARKSGKMNQIPIKDQVNCFVFFTAYDLKFMFRKDLIDR
jgi:hypothetical protein